MVYRGYRFSANGPVAGVGHQPHDLAGLILPLENLPDGVRTRKEDFCETPVDDHGTDLLTGGHGTQVQQLLEAWLGQYLHPGGAT